MRHLLFLVALFFVLVACNRNPYKATNKSYQKQMKSYAKNLRNTPRVQGHDSIKSPAYFVGNTNYN